MQSGCSTGSVLAQGKDFPVAQFKANFTVVGFPPQLTPTCALLPEALFLLPGHDSHFLMALVLWLTSDPLSQSLSFSASLFLCLSPSLFLTFSFGDFYDGKDATVFRKRR